MSVLKQIKLMYDSIIFKDVNPKELNIIIGENKFKKLSEKINKINIKDYKIISKNKIKYKDISIIKMN